VSGRRPLIGVTAAFETARWAVWQDVDVNISQRTYTDRIDETGGVPFILPTSEVGRADPDAVLDPLDALLLSGGADLDPATYGARPHPRTTNFKRSRDEFEIALCRGALERGMPVLGVCRGFQLLNVALGGDLVQHLDDAEVHLHTPGSFSDHEVELEPDSRAAAAAGATRLSVRSHHHQGIGRLGRDLVVSGRAAPGGVAEAIELPGPAWVLGILWHTEEEAASRVMRAFCEVAANVGVAG
jgi:putative glutamine amidotransferase